MVERRAVSWQEGDGDVVMILNLIFCHVVGDYILQQDFIAASKGKNFYHLFIHGVLYILPFRIVFGADWRLVVLFGTHFIIDALKARYKIINYACDQALHYLTAAILYIYLAGLI